MFRILVIKLGALGDFVQAFIPFSAIRAHWPDAEISLLTTAPFRTLAEASPWFDSVLVDERPSWFDIRGVMALRRKMQGYDLVIDLQTSGRTTRYHRLSGAGQWCGLVPGNEAFHDNPYRNEMHSVARQRDQLARLGVPDIGVVETEWLRECQWRIDQPYLVLAPGAAPHRPAKRWPASRYGALARDLYEGGRQIVIVGSAADQPLAAEIRSHCPQVQDLTGQTDLIGLGELFASASCAVGNDTGPMHLAALVGCPSLVLFSSESNPRLTAPIGIRPGQIKVLAVDDLNQLDVSRVAACLNWGH